LIPLAGALSDPAHSGRLPRGQGFCDAPARRLRHSRTHRSLDDPTDPTLTAAQRRDALKFVVHLVGDINQPLHTVGELLAQPRTIASPPTGILSGMSVSSIRYFGIEAATSHIWKPIGSLLT
jgi:S1/P1 Nuclease